MALFYINRIFKSYDNQNNVLSIDEECYFQKGSVISLLGPSGSGKSTFLNITGLLDSPSEIILKYTNNKNSFTYRKEMTELEMDLLRMNDFGFIFQSGHLLNHLNIIENIAFPLHLEGKDYKKSIIIAKKKAIELKLDTTFEKYPDQLSGGEYQRAAVARAMIKDPNVIFADEPIGNLDPYTGKLVMEYLIKWKNNTPLENSHRSIILVTHNVEDAYEYSEQIYFLHNGKLSPPINGNLIRKEEIGSKGLVDILTKFCKQEPIDKKYFQNSKNVKPCDTDNSPKNNLKVSILSKRLKVQNPPIWRWAVKELFPIRKNTKFSIKSFFKYKIQPCHSTIFNMLSVGILLITCLVMGGVLFGAINAYNQWVATNPLLTRIVAASMGGSNHIGVITEDLLNKLRLMHYTNEYYMVNEKDLTALQIDEQAILEDLKYIAGKKYSTLKNLEKDLPESIKKSIYKEQIISLAEKHNSTMINDKQFQLAKSDLKNFYGDLKHLTPEQHSKLESIADMDFNQIEDIEKHLSVIPKDLKQKYFKLIRVNGLPLNAAIFPFMYIDIKFVKIDGLLDGRTVDINDPILGLLRTQYIIEEYEYFISNTQEGFIVHKDLLDDLGLPLTSKSLQIDYDGIAYKVPILCVVSWLPDNAKYMISEGFWCAIRDKQLVIKNYNQIRIGPLPTDNEKVDVLKGKLAPLFKANNSNNFNANWESVWGDTNWLLVNSEYERYSEEYWTSIFKTRIDRRLRKDYPIEWDYKIRLIDDSEDIEGGFSPLDPTYFHVSIYVDNIDKIRPTVDYLKKEIGLYPDETNAGNLDFVESIEFFGLLLLLFIFLCLATFTVVNVYFSFTYRILQKKKEIGIMRAFGLSKKLLQKIYSLQALLIWFGALCFGFFGIPLGIFAGWIFKEKFLLAEIKEIMVPKDYHVQCIHQVLSNHGFNRLADGIVSVELIIRSSLFTMTGQLFFFDGDFILILLFLTLLLCLISTRLAISSVANNTPADLVR